MTPYEFLPPQSGLTEEDGAKLAAFLDGQDEIVAAYLVARRFPETDAGPGGPQGELHLELADPPPEGGAPREFFLRMALSLPLSRLPFTFPPKSVLPAVREAGLCVWMRVGRPRVGKDSTIADIEWELPELPAEAIEPLRDLLTRRPDVTSAYLVNQRVIQQRSLISSTLRLVLHREGLESDSDRTLAEAAISLLVPYVRGNIGVGGGWPEPPPDPRLPVFDRGSRS
jgi:hypothetical protein